MSKQTAGRRVITKITTNDEEELKQLKKRIDIASGVIVFCVCLLFIRLWYLQIHHGEEYARLSENNRIRRQEIAAPRGNLLDRKDRPIVTNRPYFNVTWTKEDAPNPDEVIKKLAKILEVDISTLLDRIREATDRPRYMPICLFEDLSWKTLVYLENHLYDLPGVRIEAKPSRDYLYGNLASHLIGYLGGINQEELNEQEPESYQRYDQIGKTGIEKIHEKSLRGEKGKRLVEVNVHGFEQEEIALQEPLPGNDLRLTIDIDLQKAAEKAIEGQAAAAVAMEVNTGKILVLASAPPLNLNDFIGGISGRAWQEMMKDPLKPLINKTIQGQYPPGSTYKIVTALAGLSEKIITPETTFFCPGSIFIYNRTYHCWKHGGHGTVSLKQALAESCDVYFYQIGQKVGVDKLALYAESLGLGRQTEIELEHEKPGLIPTSLWKKKARKEAWQDGETLSVAIGQGFDLATPIQICTMTSTLTNGGIRHKPQLLDAVLDPDGKVLQEFPPVVSGQALGSEKSRQLIMAGLVAAVNEKHGTGSSARLPNVLVGGKTGTAQVVKLQQYKHLAEKNIPYKYRDHAWFTCFAPAEKPTIAIAVMVEHGLHGGSGAAPVAKKILEAYFGVEVKVEQPVEEVLSD